MQAGMTTYSVLANLNALMRLLSFALLLTLVVACHPQAEQAATRVVTDDLGRTVTIPAQIARVVTLAPSLTETVFAAGAGDKMVGAATADTYPPAIEGLPRYGLFPIDYEAITALNPQVVLATAAVNAERDADTFTGLGIPTLFFKAETLDDVFNSLETIGDVLGTGAIASAHADSLRRAVAELHTMTDTLSYRPNVLYLIGDDQLFAFGAGNYIHDVIALAGGYSITQEIANKAPVLSETYVLETKPEVILGGFGVGYNPATMLALHPTWDIVPAIANGHVYGLDPDLVHRPGPRLVEAAYQMATYLHPHLFAEATPSTSEQP